MSLVEHTSVEMTNESRLRVNPSARGFMERPPPGDVPPFPFPLVANRSNSSRVEGNVRYLLASDASRRRDSI